MKIKKKIIYGFGSIAVVVAPITTVISCTPPKSKAVQAFVKTYKVADGTAYIAALGDNLFDLKKGATLDKSGFEVIITDTIKGYEQFNIKINGKFAIGGTFNGKWVKPGDKFELLLEADYKAKINPDITDIGFNFTDIKYKINSNRKDISAPSLPPALLSVLHSTLNAVKIEKQDLAPKMNSSLVKAAFKATKYKVGSKLSEIDLGIAPKLADGISATYIVKSKDDIAGNITVDVVLRKGKFIKPVKVTSPIVITGANDLKAGISKVIDFTTTTSTPADTTNWANGLGSDITTEFKAIPDLSTKIILPPTMDISKVTITKMLKDNKITILVILDNKLPKTGVNINNTKEITVTFTNK